MSALRQQINLYQPAASAGPAPFSFASALLALAALVACLGAFGGFAAWRVHRLARDVVALESRQARQADGLARAGASRTQASPQAIEARVEALKATLTAHTRALEALRSGAAGDLAGFSPQLIALARHPIDGLWIDHLVLAGSGLALSVGGRTFDADLVPRLLQALASERSLAGARFDSVIIERPLAAPAWGAGAVALDTGAAAGDTRATTPDTRAAAPDTRAFKFRIEPRAADERTGGAASETTPAPTSSAERPS